MKKLLAIAGLVGAMAAVAAPVYDDSGEMVICFGSRVLAVAETARAVDGVWCFTDSSGTVLVKVRSPKPMFLIVR